MADESILLGVVTFLRVTAVQDADTCAGCASAGTGICRCTTEPVPIKRKRMFYMDGT